jgi:integrase/recombinase XerD
MGIALRKKKNSDNTTSLYLDIYHSGKRSYEFLKQLKLITKPSNPKERADNKNALDLAKKILSKRQYVLEGNDYDITPAFKQNVDFVAFFKSFLDGYKKKDKRVIEACFSCFKVYLKEAEIKSLTAKELNESIVNEFKNYLSERLNGESPANYFKKFKLVIKQALRQGILIKNPALEISIKSKQGIKKQILTPEEIQLLVKTPCTNQELKKAFVFSLFTGLRFSDIQNLRWQNIDFNNGILNIVQEKTKEQVNLNLHRSALNAIGSPKKPKDLVFTLPSHTACTKGLKYWVNKAGINKTITWHCARHSFATNIIFFGADVNTASKLLGHTSFRYTERYTHIVKSLKDKAISNLPEANF